MLIVRMLLSIAIAVVGAILIVRMLSQGIRFEILPGLVLGLAMLALGLHRLSLIFHARRST